MQYMKFFKIPLVIGSVFLTIGAGLLYTLDIGTSAGNYIGYQILFGVGVGTTIQVPVIVAQAFSAAQDIPAATTTVLCKSPNIPLPNEMADHHPQSSSSSVALCPSPPPKAFSRTA